VPYLAVCDPMTGEVIRASKTTTVHYERSRPGELVHMDIKKIGRIPAGGGWRAHGRQIGKTYLQKKARIGFDYIHSVVDDHSRYTYAEIDPDEKAATAAAFFDRAVEHFAARGVAIEAIMTDNHWTYTHSNQLAQTLARIGAHHILIRPHRPWQNGRVCEHARCAASGGVLTLARV
jgi:Integrase core domain